MTFLLPFVVKCICYNYQYDVIIAFSTPNLLLATFLCMIK